MNESKILHPIRETFSVYTRAEWTTGFSYRSIVVFCSHLDAPIAFWGPKSIRLSCCYQLNLFLNQCFIKSGCIIQKKHSNYYIMGAIFSLNTNYFFVFICWDSLLSQNFSFLSNIVQKCSNENISIGLNF